MKYLMVVFFVLLFVFSAYCSKNNETDPLISKDIKGQHAQVTLAVNSENIPEKVPSMTVVQDADIIHSEEVNSEKIEKVKDHVVTVGSPAVKVLQSAEGEPAAKEGDVALEEQGSPVENVTIVGLPEKVPSMTVVQDADIIHSEEVNSEKIEKVKDHVVTAGSPAVKVLQSAEGEPAAKEGDVALEEQGSPVKNVTIVDLPVEASTVVSDAVEGEGELEKNIVELEPLDVPVRVTERKPSVITMDKPVIAGRTIAIVPFDNLSDYGNALKEIMPQLKAGLQDKGYKIINEDIVEDFLCLEKVRPASNISKRLANKLKQQTGADTVMLGSVVLFNEGNVPEVGVLARLVDLVTGSILWADYSSISGNDFTGILGLGTIKEKRKLIEKVKDELLASLKEDYSQNKNRGVHRIAVMPFQNKSGFVNAGIITTYIFLVELFKNNEFEPIEYGEVRELVIDKRVKAKGELRYENIDAILNTLDVDGVLVGTVEKYNKPANASVLPEVSISARLLTKGKNRILWYDSYHLKGDKKIIFFDWGSTPSIDRIAYKAVSSLIEKMESAKWPAD